MNIGVPRERRTDEHRVGLTPAAVELFVSAGHQCVVERDAGRGAGFADVQYERAGARIVYSGEEVYGRSGLIAKISKPTVEEAAWLQEGSVLMGFLHLAAGRRDRIETMLAKKVTAIAYETIQNDDGSLPVLAALSHMAGLMVPQVAGTLLQSDHGGKGMLLSGVPGVPPAEVVILGAGTFGMAAARAFLGLGASVYVLDMDLGRLQKIEAHLGIGRHIVMMVAHPTNIRKAVAFADVVVGAIHVAGRPEPGRGDARDGAVDEAALGRDGHRDRPGRLHRDEPSHHAPFADVRGGKRPALLRAEHDVGRGPIRDPRPHQRGVAVRVGRRGSRPRERARVASGPQARRGDAPGARGQRGIGGPPGRAGGDAVSWMDVYRQRVTTAEGAVSRIQSGQRVFMTGNCAVPQVLMDALVARAPSLRDVEVCNILTFGPAPAADPAMAGHLRINTMFISDEHRRAVNEGRADFTPAFLSEVPGLFTRGILPLDAAFVHVSPPDEHGFCSFGVEISTTKSAAQAAKVVIAEVNRQMPRTLGDAFIHVSKLDCIVEVDYALPSIQMAGTSELAQRIAGNVAGLIPDGATLADRESARCRTRCSGC